MLGTGWTSAANGESQAHAGWTLIQSRYDDGGYSGGSTERPNLRRLLEDVQLDVVMLGLVVEPLVVIVDGTESTFLAWLWPIT